jgi:hypothetical protein
MIGGRGFFMKPGDVLKKTLTLTSAGKWEGLEFSIKGENPQSYYPDQSKIKDYLGSPDYYVKLIIQKMNNKLTINEQVYALKRKLLVQTQKPYTEIFVKKFINYSEKTVVIKKNSLEGQRSYTVYPQDKT